MGGSTRRTGAAVVVQRFTGAARTVSMATTLLVRHCGAASTSLGVANWQGG
jgi:hypothetical protein